MAGTRPAPFRCSGSFERAARARGYVRIAGADEAGRGSLFGPVIAGAVVLDPARPIRGLKDSKLLQAGEREDLACRIRERAVAWAVAGATVFEIDQLNIHHASRLAMRRAIERLNPPGDFLLVDAVRVDLPVAQLPLIHGDARCRSIAAASILAKVERDARLAEWDTVFPEYGLKRHKGYCTPEHRDALERYGPTWLHRLSFEPVRLLSRLPLGPVQGELFPQVEPEECP